MVLQSHDGGLRRPEPLIRDEPSGFQEAGPLLRVRLLGHMRAEDAAGRSVLPRSRKAKAVLAILALAAPTAVLRTRITALLWSRRAKEQARASLRQAFHELQRALGPERAALLRADRHTLAMMDHRLWVDVRMRRISWTAEREVLEPFQATLLDDLDGLDPAFDAWLTAERDRLSQQRPTAASLPPPSSGIRLAVLPVRQLDGHRLDARLSGLAEEMTAAISRFRWITCVPATSSLADGISQTEYLLDSALQCCGDRIRLIVRLLDVLSGSNVIWAGRFDRQLGDLLTLQAEIVGEIAAQIDPELLLCEGDRRSRVPLAEPNANDLTLRAIPGIYRLERRAFHAAGELLASAVNLEPRNAAAHAWWAYWHVILVGQAWSQDPAAATVRAGELAERAVTLDPGNARALTLVGHVRGFLHKRPEEARALHEKALSLNSNLPIAWCLFGLTHSYLGNHEAAIEQIRHAQRLSPHDPHAFFFDMALMMPHFLRGEFEQALALGRRAVELNPGFSSTYKGYLATLGHLGRHEEAARVCTRLLCLEPGFSVRNAIERSPMRRGSDLALYADGLRRAGLPEH